MIIKDLMSDPYAWLLLSFCTIAAFIFAIYTWFKSKRKKEFTCISDSYNLIKMGKGTIPKLKLTYNDNIVENIIITKYTIWNSGNTIIEACDILNEKPLKILSTNQNTTILDVKIIAESDVTNKFKIADIKENCAVISFDFINPKDGVVIQVVHTGIESFVKIDCRIKENKNSIKLYENSSINSFKINMILSTIISILSISIVLVYSFFKGIIAFQHLKICLIITIIISVAYYILLNKINISPPAILKKNMQNNKSK